MKANKLFFLLLMMSLETQAQNDIQQSYTAKSIDSVEYKQLLKTYSVYKQLPNGFEKQALFALSHFPELKQAHILFRIKKTATPLTSRPRLLHVFLKPYQRTYLITISQQSIPFLTPILLSHLSFDAQVGVLGHELSHVALYTHQNTWQLLRISLGMLSSSYIDNFENANDHSCIDHGLGYQLLAWSMEVRNALSINKWQGASKLKLNNMNAKERYMNPSSIKAYMQTLPMYH
jgi:hypothetical protein